MSKKQKLIPYYHQTIKDGVTESARWDHYFVDEKTNVIYFLKSHNGKKIKFSTREKVPDGMKAKRFANLEMDRRTGKRKVHVTNLICEELKMWLALKEAEGLKQDTLNNIRRAKKQINEFWGDKLPGEITRDSFAEWCVFWKEKHPEISMENAVKYFNNFCIYEHEKVINGRSLMPARLRFKDPDRNETLAKRSLKKERVFTHDEFLKIYKSAVNEVEALVVHIMYTMATRVDETLKLDFGGRILLDAEIPLYQWSTGTNKAKLSAKHALHSSLVEPLSKLRKLRKGEATKLLFPQKLDNQKPLKEQQIDWAEWRKRADLDHHWTPHTFRHTCLTNLFNDAKNPQAVICKQYRVSLGVALETYIHITTEAMLSIKDSIEVNL